MPGFCFLGKGLVASHLDSLRGQPDGNQNEEERRKKKKRACRSRAHATARHSYPAHPSTNTRIRRLLTARHEETLEASDGQRQASLQELVSMRLWRDRTTLTQY